MARGDANEDGPRLKRYDELDIEETRATENFKRLNAYRRVLNTAVTAASSDNANEKASIQAKRQALKDAHLAAAAAIII